MTTTIDEIIEKIGYIKRYADTRYFDWNEAKKELKTILEEHLNKLDTGKVDNSLPICDLNNCKYYRYKVDTGKVEELIRDYELRMESEQTILKNANPIKLTERNKTKGRISVISQAIQDLQSLKSQLPENPSETSEQVIQRRIIEGDIGGQCINCNKVLFDSWKVCPVCETRIKRLD